MAIVVAGGLAVLPLALQAPGPPWLAAAVLLAVLAGLVAGAHWVVHGRRRARQRHAGLAAAGRAAAGVGRPLRRPACAAWRTTLFAAYPRRLSRLLPVAALELAFHVLAITEVYLVLR